MRKTCTIVSMEGAKAGTKGGGREGLNCLLQNTETEKLQEQGRGG